APPGRAAAGDRPGPAAARDSPRAVGSVAHAAAHAAVLRRTGRAAVVRAEPALPAGRTARRAGPEARGRGEHRDAADQPDERVPALAAARDLQAEPAPLPPARRGVQLAGGLVAVRDAGARCHRRAVRGGSRVRPRPALQAPDA